MGRDDDASSSYPWPDVDVRDWGPPRPPFPVTPVYRPRPDLARLGAAVHGRIEANVLDADDGAPDALRAKRVRLEAWPRRCVALDPGLADDADGVWARVRDAAVALAATGPGGGGPDAPIAPIVRLGAELHARAAGWAFPADPARPFALRPLRPDAAPVIDWILSRPAAERPLHALGLALQEDLAWMESDDPAEPARARLLHVCWPSGWSPADKVGRDFASIHAPVADAAMLRAAALPLSRALTTQGPFVRFVWTVAPDGARSRHPDEIGDRPAASAAAEPWFRCERQVSLPLPAPAEGPGRGGRALFLIRLHVAPLAEVASTPERLATLRDALASMSPATLAYKGLDARVDALVRWIDARLGGHG